MVVDYFAAQLCERVWFMLWLAYGIADENLALIIPNTVAAVVCSATIAISLRYR